jgi:flagellar hook protein FlgE
MRSFTGRECLCCYKGFMTNAISTALGGMSTSAAQFQKAAENVVNATQKGTEDLPKAIVDSKTSAYGYKANIAVFKTADKMMGSLLDMFT